MKLYEVPRNTYVRFEDRTYLFDRVDGMYSYCVDVISKEVMHLAAWTEVEIVEPSIKEES